MPRRCFEQFLQYLHIKDNSTIPTNSKDKIHKRTFVKTLNEPFGTRKLAVDESTIDNLQKVLLVEAIHNPETYQERVQTMLSR